jgi:hypothetical protein
MPPRPASRGWWWAALALTAAKLWLVAGQRIFAIGPAFHDDLLFVRLASHLVDGNWLGPYNQFTLAKGPMYSFFIALAFQLSVPLLLAQQVLYAAACGVMVRSLRPWLRTGGALFALYAVLLWNPMSFEAENLGRVMRQHVYTPLALLCVAGLVTWFARRREGAWRQAQPAAWAGLAFGCFWLTREESVWLAPGVALLLAAPALAVRREWRERGRALLAGGGAFLFAAALPILAVCTLNYRHYGWFGTVEFRAREFNAAYGALTRPLVGPEISQVPVTRQMREALYDVSPAFARLRPHLEGEVGDSWLERVTIPASERQIRGGWFVWALRDAAWKAGEAPDAATAMRFYQRLADEVNAACNDGRLPARPPRSGFLPPLRVDDARPLFAGALEYSTFFLLFRDFTAYAPESVGDYADLKPFRDFVGTRLSPAPRSPELPTPEQDRRNARKVDALERIGSGTAIALAWLGPLLLLVGVGRGIESVADRRLSFALGFAAALLAACGAYLAINVLVQVTSFYNMSPAALAPAYPLYLLALAGIVIDATTAWRTQARAGVPIVANPVPAPVAARPVWLVATSAALVVFGARLAEIHFFASDVPFNDQWVIEAEQILVPWLNGTLGVGDFFRPHFEHLPVWTRLLAWLQVAVTGRWDPLVQMTCNAAFHAFFAWLAVRWAWQVLRSLPAVAVTVLLVLAGGLPHAWENIAWGFQSQFPLALVLLFLHVQGSCTAVPGSRRWWWAQVAGVAGWFTIASFWLAPFALLLSWFWTGPRGRRELLAPALLAAGGAALLLLVHRAGGDSFFQAGRAPADTLHAWFHLLGWPAILPGTLAVVQLPWMLHALRLRGQAATAPADRMIFVLGAFNVMQAAALAFGRTGDNNDFVSRYGDLLFLGVLAGALAWCRLVPRGGWQRTLLLGGLVPWTALVLAGLVRNSTEGHAHYFHLNAEAWSNVRRSAVQSYLATGDHAPLEDVTARGVLYHDPKLVARVLDQAGFRELLPAGVNPGSPPTLSGRMVRSLQARWAWLLALGGLVLAGGMAWQARRRRGVDPLAPLPCAEDPWRWRAAALAGGAALAATLASSNTFAIDPAVRWQRLLGGTDAIAGLKFRFTTAAPFGPERLQGAAFINPEALRNHFYGTAPEGVGLTCTVVSSPFVLTKPWLIVPYAGYPVGNGNGLRIRIVDAQENRIGEEIGCHGPNIEGVAFWAADVRSHIGQRAQLVLYDGRTDTEAWVAASPPIPADSPVLAETLARGLKREAHVAMRISIGAIGLVAGFCGLVGWWDQRRRRLHK